jgi:ribosome modulation factor
MCVGCEIANEGREARLRGESMAVCPYPVMSARGFVWSQGWLEEDGDLIENAIAFEMQARRERA